MTTPTRRRDDVPELREGDRLTRREFHRRYEATPEVKGIELVEGVVHMPSPVSYGRHGRPHLLLGGWLAHYVSCTPGVEAADNATVLLDDRNEPQPDLMLRIASGSAGQSRVVDDYVSRIG